ncbi:MAG: alpha/beta hydrolase [Burkholderiaceae bacterium]
MNKFHHWLLATCAFVLLGCQGMPQAPALKHMDVNGVSLAYVDQGSGVPIVFVHPALLDHRIWESQRESFAKTHRFIAFDQRYFGTAPWPDKGERFSKETQIADLTTFIRGLKAGPVHLVGWSLSGDTVLSVALSNPELVRSAFVYEPGGGIEVADAVAAKQMGDDAAVAFAPVGAAIKSGDQAAAAKALIDAVENKPGSFDAAPQAVRSLWLLNARTLRLASPPSPLLSCQQLAQLKMPIAMARGALTRPYFAIRAEAAGRCIPGVHLVVAANQRHVWPANDPQSFEAALRGFLASQ